MSNENLTSLMSAQKWQAVAMIASMGPDKDRTVKNSMNAVDRFIDILTRGATADQREQVIASWRKHGLPALERILEVGTDAFPVLPANVSKERLFDVRAHFIAKRSEATMEMMGLVPLHLLEDPNGVESTAYAADSGRLVFIVVAAAMLAPTKVALSMDGLARAVKSSTERLPYNQRLATRVGAWLVLSTDATHVAETINAIISVMCCFFEPKEIVAVLKAAGIDAVMRDDRPAPSPDTVVAPEAPKESDAKKANPDGNKGKLAHCHQMEKAIATARLPQYVNTPKKMADVLYMTRSLSERALDVAVMADKLLQLSSAGVSGGITPNVAALMKTAAQDALLCANGIRDAMEKTISDQ